MYRTAFEPVMKTNPLNLFVNTAASWVTVCAMALAPQLSLRAQITANPSQHSLWLSGQGYAEAAPMLGGLTQATVMAWFKADATLNTTAFLVGQDNFQIRLVSGAEGKRLTATAKNQTLVWDHPIVSERWYHVAVCYDATSAEKFAMYINGKKAAVSGAATLHDGLAPSDVRFTMGRHPLSASEFFKGAIDEVRVFNTALPEDVIQKTVFQEIHDNANAIRGEVIPRDIPNTNWDSLLAYFRMEPTADILLDRAPNASSANPALVHNVAFTPQQPPMPLRTISSGNLDDALELTAQLDAPALYPWSILQVSHHVELTANRTVLGMVIDPNTTVALTNDNKLENTWYLKLDGKLELRGKSQLVQTVDSQLDPTSSGWIEKMQTGQSNRYNYNYWCAPAGAVNAQTNNNPYTVDAVLRDATDWHNPQPVTWTTSLDGEPTTPITLSTYWIFKFQNMAPTYANWSSVGAYGTLLPAQGFTLKGSSPESGEQQLAFIGKPNNGTITTIIAPGHLNLTGNPYPSALDANQFLKDNHGKINGTLYFWEHDAANNTHMLVDYQGGYATRNLVGGTPTFALRDPQNPALHETPGRFIPVGQGFFVRGSSTGGTVTFSNSQRAFMKENAPLSNPLFRQRMAADALESEDNANDEVIEDTFARLRIGFESPNDFHRQVLIGFMESYANSGMNPGYDAPNIDTQPYDMFLMNGSNALVIAGEGYFNPMAVYPIGIKSAVQSTVRLMLDGTENFDENQAVYLYDSDTQSYHDLRQGPIAVSVGAGMNTTRFTLRFHNPTLSSAEFDPAGMSVAFINQDRMLVIENPSHAAMQHLILYNMLGQQVHIWDAAQLNAQKLRLPVDAAPGTYIVKVHTKNGDLAKKILIL